MSPDELFINGDLLRLRREARGWVLNDMATRACMSVKQIRQLEEGGISSFYSVSVKITAAKKVGALLGLSAEEVLAQPTLDQSKEHHVLVAEVEDHTASSSQEVHAEPLVSLVDETVHVETFVSPDAVPSSNATTSVEAKSKTSLWVIVGLFVAALAVAAYMQPQDDQAAEPAPPLQVLPSDAASAAEAAASTASAESVTQVVSKSASSGTMSVLTTTAPVSASAVAPSSAASK